MIVRFNKDAQYDYHNILEIAWLFIVTELIELLIWFSVYNAQTNTINYRRLFWFVTLGFSFIAFCSLISVTCIALLTSMAVMLL